MDEAPKPWNFFVEGGVLHDNNVARLGSATNTSAVLGNSSRSDNITRLGAGTAIKLMDSSSISNPKLVRAFRETAEREGITYQMEVLPRGGTDAGAMQRARGGSAAITLSTPTRYVHTVNEMADRGDIQAGIDLLARFLERAHEVDYTL